mmetsp:Transcript_118256/g.335393  ORF Transcript_118256/g.335393 Transcript_118256/m.335393 type:complete len:223 (+) Transcript_118256:120-788(+)
MVAGAALPRWDWHGPLHPPPHGPAAAAPTSFGHGQLGELSQELKAQEQALRLLGNRLGGQVDTLPQIIAGIKGTYADRNHGVYDTLKSCVSDARDIQEKVDTFNDRITESLKWATRFNDVLRRQNDYPSNQLPAEMLENSGAVVSNLRQAQKIAQVVLKRDADDLLKVASEEKVKLAGLPAPLVACLALALAGRTSGSGVAPAQPRQRARAPGDRGELREFL